ncbi:uncharacterized protein PITG_00084 [Phytophthora infestans T30-4]|uniref:Uncharacterized protein n=1 Tax=Phytophthora infestans (strain T30-4) TaxID=403677 RepID=D0MSU8_PHYIT|nr:uncharacterized protein PITG_00084 [Phytophthora infestans T30-4]EEY57532.1 hypothetical protein PITG_00084 [Phytophthora infestans T30-4]|eukprot:XP_002908718.1 hypothetical protein PITG_00084 [Phytophthora infestans T30-4]
MSKWSGIARGPELDTNGSKARARDANLLFSVKAAALQPASLCSARYMHGTQCSFTGTHSFPRIRKDCESATNATKRQTEKNARTRVKRDSLSTAFFCVEREPHFGKPHLHSDLKDDANAFPSLARTPGNPACKLH